MSPDHDDPLIARLWRDASSEMPHALLDARILHAARAQHQRRRFLPLAAAMAACLALALYVVPLQPTPPPQMALPDTSTFGLYEGRAGVPPAAAMQQMMIRQMPGGSATAASVQQ